jgi:hypothetical protein
VALISRVHSGPNPFQADPFREGDEFTDQQHPQASWRVEAVDAAGSRVILSRSGVVVPLLLYPEGMARPQTPEPGASAAPTERTIKVVPRTRQEAAAELLAGGLTQAQVDELLHLSELDADKAAAEAALDELVAQPATDAPGDTAAKPKRRAPPPGMEGIVKLMREASRKKPAGEPEPTPEPIPEPTPESQPADQPTP